MNTQETFDMYQAAVYWGQKKDVEYRAMNDREWTLYDKEVPSGKLGVIFNPNWVYRLRPSPPPEPVKWARGAYICSNEENWVVTSRFYRSEKEFLEKVDDWKHCKKAIWPAVIEQGFLIVPPEKQ